MSDLIEMRSVVEPVEFRSAGDRRIVATGVAMRYDSKSKPIGGKFREEFRSRAFAQTVTQQDITAALEHGGPYLGRTGAATLRLHDETRALTYELDLPDTSGGRDAAALLERGDLRGASIGFMPLPGKVAWSVDTDGMALRSVKEARLFRVDLTVAPYYDSSTAEMALRSLASDRGMELRSLVEAAPADLAALISSPVEEQEGEEEPGRETPTVFRPPLLDLHA